VDITVAKTSHSVSGEFIS